MTKTQTIRGGKGTGKRRRLEYSEHPVYGPKVFYNGPYQQHTLRAWFEPDPERPEGWRFRARRTVVDLTAEQAAEYLDEARAYLRKRGLDPNRASFADIAALARGRRRRANPDKAPAPAG